MNKSALCIDFFALAGVGFEDSVIVSDFLAKGIEKNLRFGACCLMFTVAGDLSEHLRPAHSPQVKAAR
ncbi:hypothetical protein TNCV_3022121 [Trichonephila clavipes]|nr:hypothetical protein TNCV_3022121 [Trichonephila clavipes]